MDIKKMLPKEIGFVRRCLPETQSLPYYSDRESAWLLAQNMPRRAPLRALRDSTASRFLERPLVKPLVGACGGFLDQRDVLALAYADLAATWPGLGRAAKSQLSEIYGMPWHDFELSFTSWGEVSEWQWSQMSRDGGNLVVQLGFPSDHAALMGQYLPTDARKEYEDDWHPVRSDGRPTLAWARLDVDIDTGVGLIEEVQSDWLRLVRGQIAYLAEQKPRSRELRMAESYQAALRERYDRIWARVMLFATLVVLRDQLGVRDIFMHRPGPGAVLKDIHGGQPPRSIYHDLPRRFGFQPTDAAPHFLEKPRRHDLNTLRKSGAPVFWHLAL